ncbi:MAG: sugar ABC transporter permease [Chloroflexota bacterium]|jgi:multiple sugar transport system permease protein/N,N'-diacetylchitobiose transport system permease protein
MADVIPQNPVTPSGRRSFFHHLIDSERSLAWMLILPALIIVFGLIIMPILSAFWMSLHTIDLKRPGIGTPFIGLGNYADILSDAYFWASVGRTFYFMIVSIAIELVAGVSIALLLNTDFRGRNILRTLILIPWALPITIDAIMWKWIFNANYGALNSLFLQLGIISKYQAWLSDSLGAMHAVILADVWKVTPLVILLSLAALQTIPADLYEAAMIDGASIWKSFWFITFPLLLPTLMIVLLVRTMDAFKVFDIIYIMTSGGPADGTKVIAYFTYLDAFSYLRLGHGAALAYLMTFFIIIMIIIYIKVLKSREVEY